MVTTKNLRNITEFDVKLAAASLIYIHGRTTSLAVKNVLRDKGFWASQVDVSRHLVSLARQNVLRYTDNGTYRTYFKAEPVEDAQGINTPSASRVTMVANHACNSRGICMNCGCSKGAIEAFNWVDCRGQSNTDIIDTVQPPFTSLGASNYRVTDEAGDFPRNYFGVSRGVAKNLWAKDTGRKFFSARAIKIS